jgi:hypothetical protein
MKKFVIAILKLKHLANKICLVDGNLISLLNSCGQLLVLFRGGMGKSKSVPFLHVTMTKRIGG